MRKRQMLWLTPFIVAIVFAGLLLFPQLKGIDGQTAGHAIVRSPSKAPVPVITAVAKTEAFTETLEALGTARANESVVITPTLEERVVGIFFDDGDDASKGQVLVKLDDSEAQYLLAEARAGLQEQQKQFEIIRKLAKTNATSRSRLDEELSLL